MKGVKAFFDTNVVLYLLSEDAEKADRAEALLTDGGVISVQVLNEFTSVATRKLGMSWVEIREVLTQLREICAVEPISLAVHDRAITIAERYGYSIYDALILAAALISGASQLYTDDMQDGQIIDSELRISDPFKNSDRV